MFAVSDWVSSLHANQLNFSSFNLENLQNDAWMHHVGSMFVYRLRHWPSHLVTVVKYTDNMNIENVTTNNYKFDISFSC